RLAVRARRESVRRPAPPRRTERGCNMSELNRRTFLGAAAGTVAGASLAARASADGPNDTIRAAVLGLNGRGKTHIGGFMGTKGVKVAVLCDPDRKVLDDSAKRFEEKYGYKPDTETDLRKVYERKDVDVVGVATPNHWHALATIWACQAGKDVYVEKPVSHNVSEGRRMVEAARKHGRIVQTGTQCRSQKGSQDAMALLRSGKLGKVYIAKRLRYK